MGRKFTLESDFYCCKCGNKGIPIVRCKGAEREAGHLKRLFCLTCKQEWNHAECKPFTHYEHDDFLFEMQNGNFDENGNRKMPYGLFKDKMMREGVVK